MKKLIEEKGHIWQFTGIPFVLETHTHNLLYALIWTRIGGGFKQKGPLKILLNLQTYLQMRFLISLGKCCGFDFVSVNVVLLIFYWALLSLCQHGNGYGASDVKDQDNRHIHQQHHPAWERRWENVWYYQPLQQAGDQICRQLLRNLQQVLCSMAQAGRTEVDFAVEEAQR